MSPTRWGPYEFVAAVGAGGMGEVFRARDTKLNRDVAIKVLPAEFARDHERVARFRREAQILASLNHPNIAAIHGLEEDAAGGTIALAMEYVDGEDLAERLKRGAIPVDEAIQIAKQIAEALEEAHEHGVIHRDLKPANVKVTSEGKVKVLDFGLAKAIEGDAGTSSASNDVSHSPTMTKQGTVAGMILGTAAYMSPEQARGKRVDKRADIWSFGVVLFEMLTGKRLFEGETVSDVLASVLKTDPDFGALPADVPAEVRTLLEHCLDRTVAARLRDIGDARWSLAAPRAPSQATTRKPWRGLVATAVLSALVSGFAVWTVVGREQPEAPVVRASFPVGAPIRAFNQNRQIAISPDGSMIGAVTREGTIMLRRLDELTPVAIPGASGVNSLFFSPDSRHLGYTTEASIHALPLAGGPTLTLAEGLEVSRNTPLTASWGEDGRVTYATLDGIASVPATGGERRAILKRPDAREPLMLPGERYLLYTKSLTNLDEIRLHRIGDDPSGESDALLTQGTGVRYLASGHLLFARDTDLFAAAWDIGSPKLSSEPVRAASGIAFLSDFAQYDVSRAGTLIHYPSSSVASTMGLLRKVGARAVSPLGSNAQRYSDARISPDGSRIAFHISGAEDDVWVLDAARDLLTRVTFDRREDETPAWSPDGIFLAYSGFARDGTDRVVLKRRADGGGGEEVLVSSAHHMHVTDWSRDGRFIVLELVQDFRNRDDVAFLELDASGKPKGGLKTFLGTAFAESSGRVSPDSKWIAYRSNESGLDQIYVQPFPDGGRKIQVSSGGGIQPVWSHDGRSLYFRAPSSLMVARVKNPNELAFDAPTALFEDRFARPQSITHTTYDAFRDGTFLFIEPIGTSEGNQDNAVILATFNWTQNFLARLGK